MSRNNIDRALRMGLILAFVGLVFACGNSTNTPPSSSATTVTPLVSVSVSPGSVVVGTGQSGTAQFTATVRGGSNSAVTWAVNGVAGGNDTVGTISSSGVYTSPSAPTSAVVTVTATSGADSTKSASSSVTLVTSSVTSTPNPLVAQYSFTAPAAANFLVQFGTTTSYGLETWSQHIPPSGGTVNMLVAGMRASTAYHMRISASFAAGVQYRDTDHTFTTGGLPNVQIAPISASAVPGMSPSGGVELLDLVNPNFNSPSLLAVATDLSGNVIWYLNGQAAGTGPNPVKLLPNGHMLVNYSVGQSDGASSLLQEVDLAGNVVWQMNGSDLNQALAAAGYNLTVIGTHHDVAVLPNGHLVVIASTTQTLSNLIGYPANTVVTGDVLIDLDLNHKPVWVWNEFNYLDVNRHPMGFPDWTHTNAILYSPSDGDLIVSSRHQHWIIKVDYQNGQGSGNIVWKLGWQGDFTLVGGTDPIDWFYAQHGPSIITPNSSGNFQMILFDNGDYRVADNSGNNCGLASGCYSTVPIFQIDEAAKTATVIWRDNLQPSYSFFGGNAEVLSNGDVEFDQCDLTPLAAVGPAYITEVTNGSNPQMVWQMEITGFSAYRAFRIPSLYPGVRW